MRQDHPVTFATLLVAFAIVGLGTRLPQRPQIPPLDADALLSLPADGNLRHALDFPSAWQLAGIPTALRFESPLGSQHGALTVRDGNDLDGIGGKNTDLGDPVFASADGLVIFAGQPSPESGNTIVLAHRDRDGHLLESKYGRLDRIDVTTGALVARGQTIGTVGTANGYHPALLHFEMPQEGSSGPEEDLVPAPLAVALKPGG